MSSHKRPAASCAEQMKLLERVLTPRVRKKSGASQTSPPLTLSLAAVESALESPRDAASTPRRASSLRKLVSAAGRMLTPRGGRARGSEGELAESPFASSRPRSSETILTQAYRPTLTGLMEQQLWLPGQLTTTSSRHHALETIDSDSDTASEANSEISSLDGFGEYARRLGPAVTMTAATEGDEEASPGGSSASSSPADQNNNLPSPRQLMAQVSLCSARPSAPDSQRVADDLQLLLQAGELPVNRQRLARLLVYADALGGEAFAGLSLHHLGFERCVALLLQLLLPLPLRTRSGALALLQSQLAAQLMSYLGSGLERVLESERACQRFSRLPFEVASWLLEHGSCDRGETLLDLGNLWLEQQPGAPPLEQQRALAALVWRRPLAADFLRCMAANLPWAAECVATSALRPACPPPSLDGRFSFTAEFELHDFLELQQAAMAEGRLQQKQSPALYCGGFCWWTTLAALARPNRFELYACCAPFSLFQAPFRAALQPGADVHFAFQGKTSLADWRQTNAQRLDAMHTHWGGGAFWAPSNSPAVLARDIPHAAAAALLPGSNHPLAAAARPDTARNLRTASHQLSRLSVSSSGGLPSAATTAAPAGTPPTGQGRSSSLGRALSGALATPSLANSPTGTVRSRGQLAPGYLSAADSGAMTARQLEPEGGLQLQQLTMDQVVAEVRHSCPYSWGASLRVRVHFKLLGDRASEGEMRTAGKPCIYN